MSDVRPFRELTRECQRCETEMPVRSVRSFKDDEAVLYVCRDTEACEARLLGDRPKFVDPVGPEAFAAFNQRLLNLTKRIQDLEARQRAMELPTLMRPEPPDSYRPFWPGVS